MQASVKDVRRNRGVLSNIVEEAENSGVGTCVKLRQRA